MSKKKSSNEMIQLLEYGAAASLFFMVRLIPFAFIRILSNLLGRLFFRFVPRRRKIALDNLAHAFPDKKAEELARIARGSFTSIILTFLEFTKFRRVFTGPDALERVRESSDGLEELFQKARRLHDESGGCLFVTPHIGNWEFLPHVSALVGIPLTVVVRPLDNPHLEQLIYQSRTETGQAMIPKRNAFFVLQKTLQSGRSIGMLPDQSTMKGISVDFFGRLATATPVPALLAITHKRPIVVVACCRTEGGKYEGFVCDPIWPGDYESEKAEIFRITTEMTKNMESIIRKYPEQYLWMHNRWKTYKDKKEFLS
ncbi:MAG: lysophospholipid acyltransferase family protein [Nitrospirae bacterium]|nr:lysophospholipid acyltransferase family protein [Nitrospirota bacterium]